MACITCDGQGCIQPLIGALIARVPADTAVLSPVFGWPCFVSAWKLGTVGCY